MRARFRAETFEARVLMLTCAWSVVFGLVSYLAATSAVYGPGFLIILWPVPILVSVLAGILTAFAAVAARAVALRAHARQGVAHLISAAVAALVSAAAFGGQWATLFQASPPVWSIVVAGVVGGIAMFITVRSQDRVGPGPSARTATGTDTGA